MKTFGCFAALVGLTIGFASAGPVAVNGGGGSSMCDIQCGSQSKFKYVTGKSYIYKYSTKTETALEQSSDEKSTIYLDADISLHVIDSCRFALKVDSAKLDEEVTGGARRASRGTQELAESLIKNPLIFNYEDGMVSRLCPAQHESKSALNIKRGILSMIQNKMADFSQSDVHHEGDVNGECRAVYSAAKDWGGQIRIVKEKILSECKRDNEHQVVSVIALPRQVAKSSSMINGTQECRQVIKNSIFDSVECTERHVVKPFSRQEKGAATEVHQILKLQRSGAEIQASGLSYPEGEEETLRFDPTYDVEIQDNQAETRARGILSQLANEKHHDIKQVNDEFVQLVGQLRKMRYDSLKRLGQEFKQNQWYYDALVDTYTRDAMKLVAELVKARAVSAEDAQGWLINVAMTTDVDVSRIQMLLPLLDMEDLTLEAHLAVSSLARTYMEENPSEIPEEINNLLRRLYSQLKSGTSNKMMIATIKAIGNLGISNGHESKLLEVTAKQSTEMRLAAIEAFRRLPCDMVNRDMLMQLFTQSSEDVEVRVAAYLNSITCPTEDMITTVRDTLRREPRGSQLSSFVFSHVKNLGKRSSFNEDVSLITSDERLKSLELDSGNFSKNHYYEMFFNPLDMGFELDANSLVTSEFMSAMLNTTFDMFGHKANVFDGKIRFRRDMSHTEILTRFFGKEVFYQSEGRQGNAEFDAILKSIMSHNGWKYSRSTMILDVESILPTGSGLPLVVGVNGTGSIDFDLKAMPLQGQQGSKFVAEVRSAPSVAMQFGISMMMKAPQTNSGIKMVVTSASQWDLRGRVNVDLSDSRMVRNIQIDVPRERSDLIDIKSNVYLVGANSQHEIKATGTVQKHLEMCTGNTVHVLAGHKACVEATYPQASGDDSPFFMLRGPSHFNVRWVKTDKALKMFQIQSSFMFGQQDLIELAFEMDTPGSEVNRKFKGRLYGDRRNHKFGVDMISPMKSVNLLGSYEENSSNKKTELLLKVDNRVELALIGKLETANGRATIWKPSLEITRGNEHLVRIQSEIVSQGSQKFNGDMSIESIFTRVPIKMNGEYSIVNSNKRLSFGIDSEWLKYNVQSSVSQQARNWDLAVKGDYIYNKGSKNTFSVGGKLIDDRETIAVEMMLKRNEKTFVSGRGKLNRSLPPNVDMALELLQGRFKTSLSLKSENSKADLIAMAVIDNEKYQTLIKFNQAPRLTSFSAVLGLPNNVERKLNLQFDLASPVKRLVLDTDLTGKPYSARVSYMPSDKLHKVSASAKMDKESAQVTAMLGTDPVYQTSVDIVHNGAKFLSTSVGVNLDKNKPDVKVYLQLREKPLVDLATDTRIERESVTIGLKMLAPIEVTANAGIKKSGSLDDTLSLATEIEVSSPDRMINMGLSSSAEISLWQRSNKVNIQTTVRSPGGTSDITFNNVLDGSSWSIDWSFKGPNGQQKQHVQSSGTYNLVAPKIHLRGGLDMDIRPFNYELKVENVALDTQLSLHENEVDFKTEVSAKDGKTAFLVGARAGNGGKFKHGALELNLMGKPYHLKVELDGNDLSSGWRTTVDAKYHDKSVLGTGNLRWDGQFIFINMDFQTKIRGLEQFETTKLLLQTQTFTQGSVLMNAEYALAQHFAKAEVIINQASLEADIRTSIPDWQNVKAQATWELKPKMIFIASFSSAKYKNNAIQFEMENGNGVTARLTATAPAFYSGTFLDGNLKYTNGQGIAIILLKGQQKAKMTFVLRNEDIVKNLSGDLTYNLDGVSDRWNFEMGVENGAKKVYDAKLSLRKNSEVIADVIYKGALNTEGGVYVQNRLEARTNLPGFSQDVYLHNKLVVNAESMHTQHEIGNSPKDIRYSVDALGQLVNNRDIFVMNGKLDGKWDRVLKASASAELKTDRKNVIQWASKVESNQALVCSSRMSLIRRNRLVEFEAFWSAPKLQPETTLTMRSGIEEPETFVFETKLDRDQDAEKSALFSFRLPLQTRNIDGHLKVKMPRELGSQALMASLMAKKTMFNINAVLSMGEGRQTYSGEIGSAWEQDFTLNGFLKKNSNNILKANLRASMKHPGAYEFSAEAMHNEVSYRGKVRGALTQRTGDIAMEAESSQWDRKHLLRGTYSLDAKTGNLKIDIAKLKISIDSLMSGSYKLRGDAQYDGESIADVTLNFDPTTKQGNLEAVVSKKRMTSNFVARMDNGELKMDLPSGSSSLSWNLDERDKMSVAGLWTFHNDKWRLEAFVDPRDTREAEAKLSKNERRVGYIYAMLQPEQIIFKIHFEHAGKSHSAELSFVRQDGSFNGIAKINCPWIHPDPIESTLKVEYAHLRRVLISETKIGSQVYSIKANGVIEGDRISGTVETRCPYPNGNMNANLEGKFEEDKFKIKLTSDKLEHPIEIEGIKAQEKMGIDVSAPGYQIAGIVYTGPKHGVEFFGKYAGRDFKLSAVFENLKLFKILISTPEIHTTGITLFQQGPGNYGVEGNWSGKKILTAKLTGTPGNMRTGVLNGDFDFGGSDGKHNLIINYSLERTPSLKITLDGHVILDGSFERENHRMAGKWTVKFARGGDLTFEVKHQLNREVLLSSFRVSQNNKALGYEARLHKDILGSMLRIDTPKRSVMMELDRKQAAGNVAGRLQWDHGRDAQKSIEFVMSREHNNNVQGAGMEQHLTVSIPKLGEKVIIRVTETDGGHRIQVVDEKRSKRTPQMTMMYSREGKLKMVLGNLMMQAQMSSKKSELIVRRMTAQEDDINVGYSVQGNTLSARLNWTPRLLANYKLVAKNMLKELQKGPDSRQDKQLRRISEFITTEITTIRDDIGDMIMLLEIAYYENYWYLRSIFEPLVRVAERVSRYAESAGENMREMSQALKRILARYTQRLAVASTIMSAIRQEVTEDFIDSLERWLARVEKSISNENIRSIVQRLIRFAKQDYQMIADAADHALDEYVCEFSSEQTQLTNKRCGFAYELDSQNQQHGLTMRLPVSVMRS